MSNTFGRLFRFTTFGESHGAGMGVVIDGCPAGLELDLSAIQADLDRRKPGQSRITTQRKEPDEFEVLSGLVGNTTTGAPIGFFVRNKDQKSKDYDHIEQVFRPSHADYTYFAKYGIRDHRGGGRSSARETLARVIAGGVAKQLLAKTCGMEFDAWVASVGTIRWEGKPKGSPELTSDATQMVRCPDPTAAEAMFQAIDEARKAGDSLGGTIAGRVRNVPAGLGEPIYHKIESALASAMMTINATKGFEIGSGFGGTEMKGSDHNDIFYEENGVIRTRTNRSGGVQGGITNGESIEFRVALKPTSTIMQAQNTVDSSGNDAIAEGKGRHDPCVVPRAVPIVEAMAACVMADMWLLGRNSHI